jgi:light-regulated signal transduction histidine kinase (bacteriophytochrome)
MRPEVIDVETCEREQLLRALRERTAQLEAANKEFEEFSHSVSHDLRAPLRAVEGFAQILVEDYAQQLDPEAKHCLEIIGASSRKASLLIEDLLVLSRLNRQELRRARINMEDLVKSTIKDFEPAASRVEFKIRELPEAWADPALLKQVLRQLLDNAIKFTRRQVQPCVEIGGRLEPEQTAYYVRDNGVGFDMKHVGRLFSVFQRLHSEQEFEGRGIGLAIVRRIIHRHGGEVGAEGKLGESASFFFSLPVEKGGEGPLAAEFSSPQ